MKEKDETPLSDLGRMMFEQVNAMNNQFSRGMEATREQLRIELKTLFAAYDRACLDPDAKIPTRLHMAMESLRKRYAS